MILVFRAQTVEALNAADASAVDQPGHILNLVVRGVSGTVCVDGKDAVSFAESTNAVYVCLHASSACHCISG